MNNKTLLVVLLVGGVTLWALLLRNGEVLVLAVPLLVYLLVGLGLAPGKLKLSGLRTLSRTTVLSGDEVEMTVELQNAGPLIPRLLLADREDGSLPLRAGQLKQSCQVREGETVQLSYRFQASRGQYIWETVQVVASDPFQLFERSGEIPAAAELLVYPAPIRISKIPLQPESTLHSPGLIPARGSGSGTDFWGVREFRQGDSLSQVNWRLGARYPGQLFSNLYQKEEIADFGLILDARESSSTRSSAGDLFEYAVAAAAAFAEKLIKSGNRVSLLVFGEVLRSVFPGSGKNQLLKLQRELIRAQLGKNIPLNYLDYFPIRLFPSGSLIVIFSAYDAKDFQTYARLLALGYRVLLICPDRIAFTSRDLPRRELISLAARTAKVERRVSLSRLVSMGVKVIDWQVDQALELALHQAEGPLRGEQGKRR